MEVKSVSGAIGGVVSNIDLTQSLTSADLRSLRQALLDYQVLFFREQPMMPAQH